MTAPSFRLRVHQAVIALATLVVLATGFAFVGALQVDRSALRSRNAQAVLAAHITISNSAFNLFKQMSDAVLLDQPIERAWTAPLTDAVSRDIAVARRLIALEFNETGYDEDETEELDRIAAIELEIDRVVTEFESLRAEPTGNPTRQSRREVAALINDRIDKKFNHLITAAIAEERREVAEADRQLQQVSSRIRRLAIVVFILGVILTSMFLYYINGALLSSLRALTSSAEAFSAGDLSHRSKPLRGREFDLIRMRFEKMAAELAANRAALQSSNERLEREVIERTGQLAEANRRLEETDSARRSFFADISHELRTPLTIIRGEAEIALRGAPKESEDYRESLSRIVEYVGETTRLVDDLLFMARADAGEPRLDLRNFALNPLIAECVRSFEPIAAARSIRFVRVEDDASAVVFGDRGRIAQVIGVLLDNAVRYSQDGGEVRVRSSLAGDVAVLSVEDDGIGIAPAEAARLFERFYRGDKARLLSGGSGLGLPVAKAIIEAHNGHIRVTSSSTGGALAEVSLPAEAKLRAIS